MPGRPRSEQARQAILDTAYRIILDEGLGRLTIERVAAEAGVGKPTIYRYWPNAHELAMAAFLARPETEFAHSPAASGKQSLKDHMKAVLSAFATPRGRQITLAMASADRESELAKAFRNRIILKSRETGRALLLAAEAAGELHVGSRMETILDMIYGPVFYRLLAGHQPLSPAFGSEIVDIIFASLEARRPK